MRGAQSPSPDWCSQRNGMGTSHLHTVNPVSCLAAHNLYSNLIAFKNKKLLGLSRHLRNIFNPLPCKQIFLPKFLHPDRAVRHFPVQVRVKSDPSALPCPDEVRACGMLNRVFTSTRDETCRANAGGWMDNLR